MTRTEQFAARYRYRPFSERDKPFGPWTILTTALASSRDGAAELVADWNRRDAGRWCWEFDECLPTDIDYPLRPGRAGRLFRRLDS